VKRKVDLKRLEALRAAGMGVRAIAKELGVSPGTISTNQKLLDFSTSKDVALRCAAEINNQKIDAMGQLNDLNRRILKELTRIENSLDIAAEKHKDRLRDHQRKHAAEVRKQLTLFLNICQTLYNWEQVMEFQNIVLEEIGKIDEGLRKTILQRLAQRRSARSVLGSGEPGI